MPNIPRHKPRQVRVGHALIGGGAPVLVQSMTNTDPADAGRTADQVFELARAGSEIVRVTVNTAEAAAQVPRIRERLDARGCDVPLVGDFHFNGHKLLAEYPDCARTLAKYRINPGNVGRGARRDEQFATMIEIACRNGKPVRIGVNWGSLDQELLARLMDENARLPDPLDSDAVTRSALVVSALESAARAEELGLPGDRIVLSCKVSGVQDLIAVYRELARRCDYPLHRRARRIAPGGYRRHDSHFPHPGPGRGPDARGHGRSGIASDHGLALVLADGDRLSGVRPHHQHLFPGARRKDPALPARADAEVARALSRSRGHARRSHGLRRQRPR